MSWETAVRLLEMQSITPTEHDKKLWEQGFFSHIIFPSKDRS